jgi:hypothetical protein
MSSSHHHIVVPRHHRHRPLGARKSKVKIQTISQIARNLWTKEAIADFVPRCAINCVDGEIVEASVRNGSEVVPAHSTKSDHGYNSLVGKLRTLVNTLDTMTESCRFNLDVCNRQNAEEFCKLLRIAYRDSGKGVLGRFVLCELSDSEFEFALARRAKVSLACVVRVLFPL